MGDVRTEVEVNADYTMVVAKLGDSILRMEAIANKARADQQELIKQAQALSQEMDKLKAPPEPPDEAA